MAYTENQYFYAALYWTAALSGGLAFIDDICAAHQKPMIPLSVCARRADDHEDDSFFRSKERATLAQRLEDGVTAQQAKTFFETLYRALRLGCESESTTWTKPEYRYISLSREAATSGIDYCYSETIEAALTTSGLPRVLLPLRARSYLHETGQVFIYDEADRFTELAYPGKPDLDYDCRRLDEADFAHLPELRMEILHRVVPVAPGQDCVIRWDNADGVIETHAARTRSENGAVIVAQGDADDISALTDEEILTGSDKVRGCTPVDKSEFTPGHQGACGKYVIATDDPRIVCWRSGVVRCLQLDRRTQVFCGGDFRIAEAGDMIRRDALGNMDLLPREDLAAGRYQLVPAEAGPAPVLHKGRPKPQRGPRH